MYPPLSSFRKSDLEEVGFQVMGILVFCCVSVNVWLYMFTYFLINPYSKNDKRQLSDRSSHSKGSRIWKIREQKGPDVT